MGIKVYSSSLNPKPSTLNPKPLNLKPLNPNYEHCRMYIINRPWIVTDPAKFDPADFRVQDIQLSQGCCKGLGFRA